MQAKDNLLAHFTLNKLVSLFPLSTFETSDTIRSAFDLGRCFWPPAETNTIVIADAAESIIHLTPVNVVQLSHQRVSLICYQLVRNCSPDWARL